MRLNGKLIEKPVAIRIHPFDKKPKGNVSISNTLTAVCMAKNCWRIRKSDVRLISILVLLKLTQGICIDNFLFLIRQNGGWVI